MRNICALIILLLAMVPVVLQAETDTRPQWPLEVTVGTDTYELRSSHHPLREEILEFFAPRDRMVGNNPYSDRLRYVPMPDTPTASSPRVHHISNSGAESTPNPVASRDGITNYWFGANRSYQHCSRIYTHDEKKDVLIIGTEDGDWSCRYRRRTD